MSRTSPVLLGGILLWMGCAGELSGATPRPAFTMAQTISDGAQRTTLAFAGLGMMTGNLEAQSFFPPGKVADYTGFQYLRDNDPDDMGHNTSFLTRVAFNVLYILNDTQLAQLKTLAIAQQDQINLYGYKRFALMKAFRRLMDGDLPANCLGLDLDAVKAVSRELYLLDGQISFDRALLYANIYNSMDANQKAYLDAMKGKGWSSWPAITNDQIRTKTQGLTQTQSVAVMTYAGDLFSWYAGSLDADVYFCPERHGTYFGSFYIKDAPAIGHEGYSIDEQLTATAGAALCDSSKGYVTAEQAAIMSSLVALQKSNLYAGTTNIVSLRTQIATLLRSLLVSTASSESVKAQVLTLSGTYGDLDGENNFHYATVFANVCQSLNLEQKNKLAGLRKTIMSGTYSDGAAFDFSVCSTPFLYSSAITDASLLAPYIGNTDYLFLTGSAPETAFTYTPEPPTVSGQKVNFTDCSTNAPASWLWDFGDGSTSTAQNPSHFYRAQGTFAVTLVATNAAGSGTSSQLVTTSVLPSDVALSALNISFGCLSPVFSPDQTDYSASIANRISRVTITPIKTDLSTVIKLRVNGGSFTTAFSGIPSSSLLLDSGTNTIEVNVSSRDGLASKTYTITVYRVALPVTGEAMIDLDATTLAGTVDGHAESVVFQYGLTAAYGNITSQQILSSNSSAALVSATLAGLLPATLYHYRVLSTTGAYSDYGLDQTFVSARPYDADWVAIKTALVPGTSDLEKFFAFGSPSINFTGDSMDRAHYAFQALLTGSLVTSHNNSGIWVCSGSDSNLIARTGNPAPGGGVFASLRDPVLNNYDDVAFIGTVTGTGYNGTNNTGIWANTSGTLHLVAQTRGAALDSTGVKAAAILQTVLPDESGVIFLASLVPGIGNANALNNLGIWTEENGQLKSLIRKGDVLGGGTISSLSLLGAPLSLGEVRGQGRSFNGQGQLAFKATFTNRSQGIFVLSGTNCAQIADTGVADEGLFALPTEIVSVGDPILNGSGNTAFQVVVSGTASGAPHLQGILAETGTAHLLGVVALAGQPAPNSEGVLGQTGTFASMGTPVFNGKDQVAFIGKLKTGGFVTSSNAEGIWANTSGTLALVARAQGQAPACAPGVRFLDFTELVLPEKGGVIFQATLAGTGVSSANNKGIWVVDAGGEFHLVSRTGDVLAMEGEPKVVSRQSIFSATLGAQGQSRSFNSNGDLIFKVTFTDRTQALRKIQLP